MRIPLAIAVSCCLLGCRADPPLVPDTRPVRTLTVTPDAVADEAVFAGEVRARYESAIAFRVAGRVAERLVQAGDRVRKGQPLARLDVADADLNAASAAASLASARSELAQASVEYERSVALHAKRFVSDAELDRDRARYDGARAQFDAARAQHALATNQREYATLRAPWDGVVTEIGVEVGRVVIAGQSVARVAADGAREVEIGVPEARLADVRRAEGIVVELWARAEWHYAGHLRELAPATDGATRLYTARIALDDADAAVDLGMTARVRVRLPSAGAAVALPLAALLRRESGAFVWVFDGRTGRVHARPVAVASVDRDFVRIGSGLAEGDVVVTAGVHLLHEGQVVRPLAADADAGARA